MTEQPGMQRNGNPNPSIQDTPRSGRLSAGPRHRLRTPERGKGPDEDHSVAQLRAPPPRSAGRCALPRQPAQVSPSDPEYTPPLEGGACSGPSPPTASARRPVAQQGQQGPVARAAKVCDHEVAHSQRRAGPCRRACAVAGNLPRRPSPHRAHRFPRLKWGCLTPVSLRARDGASPKSESIPPVVPALHEKTGASRRPEMVGWRAPTLWPSRIGC